MELYEVDLLGDARFGDLDAGLAKAASLGDISVFDVALDCALAPRVTLVLGEVALAAAAEFDFGDTDACLLFWRAMAFYNFAAFTFGAGAFGFEGFLVAADLPISTIIAVMLSVPSPLPSVEHESSSSCSIPDSISSSDTADSLKLQA